MRTTTERTVKELVLENPDVARIFEKLGIDYCCGGNRSLDEACRAANLPMGKVLNSLKMAGQCEQPAKDARDWQNEPLADLISHIQGTHHRYTREEIARLVPLFAKVCSQHEEKHPELLHLRAIFAALAQELTVHMMKEEMVLFPYIERVEEAFIQKETVLPPPFGSAQNPITMMEHEHDSAGKQLREMRRVSNDYMPPADACLSYETLFRALAAFEADLHLHIHLENNILFPRAIAMEKAG